MTQKLKVSVVQTCTASYSLPETLDKLDRLVRLAKERDGSQFCVFPEAFVGGYPRFSSFGTVIGSRTPAGRDEFLRYHSAAITLSPDSPARIRIESVARRYGVFLVVGVIEKDDYAASTGTLYCSAIFVDPERGLVGKHRKLMPTASERIVWGMGDGSTLPVLDFAFATGKVSDEKTGEANSHVNAKVSATICWENYMPLRPIITIKGFSYIARRLSTRAPSGNTRWHILRWKVDALSCPLANMHNRKIFQPAMRFRRALSQIQRRQVMIGGGSVIVGPLGDVLAGPLESGEGVLTAEVDLDDCIRGKLDLDVVGHYARPDIFKLIVQE
ncbi:carbon-nitrogen hydrolase [Ceratobasidium sp. AG-Ba]|nr:carbon-nitrogen hydrolase [Ceratobasidium sp. AG-Ba]